MLIRSIEEWHEEQSDRGGQSGGASGPPGLGGGPGTF